MPKCGAARVEERLKEKGSEKEKRKRWCRGVSGAIAGGQGVCDGPKPKSRQHQGSLKRDESTKPTKLKAKTTAKKKAGGRKEGGNTKNGAPDRRR